MEFRREQTVYITEEEFSEALRSYVQGKGVEVGDYPTGPIAYHENKEWRLCFYAEKSALNA